MTRRFLAFVLAFIMLFSSVPTQALAATAGMEQPGTGLEEDITASETCTTEGCAYSKDHGGFCSNALTYCENESCVLQYEEHEECEYCKMENCTVKAEPHTECVIPVDESDEGQIDDQTDSEPTDDQTEGEPADDQIGLDDGLPVVDILSSDEGDAVEGRSITQAYGSVVITGRKIWEDSNNADGLRPSSINVHLYANGSKVFTETVTAENNWNYSFDISNGVLVLTAL